MVLQNEPLVVSYVEMFAMENAERHHTANFELVHLEPSTPVLRRGQPFSLLLSFEGRGFDDSRDIVRLIFNFGPNPSTLNGTRAMVLVGQQLKPGEEEQWTAKVTAEDATSLSLEVTSPPDIPVGVWQMQVKTQLREERGLEELYKYENDIYLLFNPWLREDQVFMDDERLLEEYVLNDVGKIWVGPHTGFRGREWVFGQFDAAVLPAIMLMLERSRLNPAYRGNPVLLSRKISKMVNSEDEDGGVLEGRWDGEYEDGTAPGAWSGSIAIMEEYLTKKRKVKYGQCWVFAGVAATVCRALGIASRPISNLVSAHDANETMSIDRYYNEVNEEIPFDPHNPYGGADSVWNYHVWTEAWMARPDLPKGYGGWQAIDPTPQETSESWYQCGPASVEAVRNGAVGLKYDVAFMQASVNADMMRWKRSDDHDSQLGYSRIACNKYHIGRFIFTKQPWVFDPNGDKDRQDITESYKPKEGSRAERLSLMNGVRSLEKAKSFFEVPDSQKADVEFDLVELETINIGESYSVTVNIENKSSEVRTVQVMLSSESIYYNGIKARPIKKAQGDFKIQPNNKEKLKLVVHADDYLDKLVEYCNMKICAIATVLDTNYTWAEEDDFMVLKPPITITIPKAIPLNEPTTATLTFKNPLNKTLTNCKFRVEAPGFFKPLRPVTPYKDVEPFEDVEQEYTITATKQGDMKLVATFSSTELVDVTGSATIEVL